MAVHLYEVEVRNRVVKGLGLRIYGMQGNWYPELLYFLAESEEEAQRMAWEKVKKRRILGIPKHTKRNLKRQIEILNTRRTA